MKPGILYPLCENLLLLKEEQEQRFTEGKVTGHFNACVPRGFQSVKAVRDAVGEMEERGVRRKCGEGALNLKGKGVTERPGDQRQDCHHRKSLSCLALCPWGGGRGGVEALDLEQGHPRSVKSKH